jgi:hypothetical protein
MSDSSDLEGTSGSEEGTSWGELFKFIKIPSNQTNLLVRGASKRGLESIDSTNLLDAASFVKDVVIKDEGPDMCASVRKFFRVSTPPFLLE